MAVRDALQRPLSSLRLSVTDRCNLRCAYCMPEEEYRWLKSTEILSFEELSQVVDAFIEVGVRKVRITGGEPLVRRDVTELVRMIADKPLEEVAMTSNGLLLRQHARALKAAGLKRLTVSIDTLSRERFLRLTRRDQLSQVLDGIAAAADAGFEQLKFDTVVMRGVNDDELEALLAFAASQGAELRFIEYMDVGGATKWSMNDVVSSRELLATLGPVVALPGRGSAPAERFQRPNGQIFGIIASTTQPFCASCDRSRVTADGRWFTCLYAQNGIDLRTPLRSGEPLAPVVSNRWTLRNDRGAEDRVLMRTTRGPLASPAELKAEPHLEMHTRGG